MPGSSCSADRDGSASGGRRARRSRAGSGCRAWWSPEYSPDGSNCGAAAIGSTIVGEGIDSALFYPLAFWGSGIIPDALIPQLMLSQWIAKTLVEVALTPITYKVVGFLKRAEREDWYDRDTNFTPFRF